MKKICQDLRDEYEELDNLVTSIRDEEWQTITPFYDWTIYDEICHIAYFDNNALLATSNRNDFRKHVITLMEIIADDPRAVDLHKRVFEKTYTVEELIAFWRNKRNLLLKRLESSGVKDRFPWYGPDMSALSFATARIMEVWAHGQDVFDALKIKRVNTDRIKHIAHLGVTTFGWSFLNRNLELPNVPIRVELYSPSGQFWSWGPSDAMENISGAAEEFCLVVTQRRNVNDTKLNCTGDVVKQWMEIAQCFAGPPANAPNRDQRVLNYAA